MPFEPALVPQHVHRRPPRVIIIINEAREIRRYYVPSRATCPRGGACGSDDTPTLVTNASRVRVWGTVREIRNVYAYVYVFDMIMTPRKYNQLRRCSGIYC